MSADLDMTTGKPAFARLTGTASAWHGLGQTFDHNATLEELLTAGCVDFEIKKVPNFHYFNGELIQANDYSLLRSDNGHKFTNCSSRYQPVQPATIVGFMHGLASKYDLKIDTIGALDKGERVWCLAQLGESFTLAGGDRVDGYALITTSNDGTMATRVMFTTVRVVCNNTLTMALAGEKKNHISVSHATSFDPDQVEIDLGLVHSSFAAMQAKAEKLSRTKMDKDLALKLLIDLFEEKGADANKISTRNMNIIQGVYNKFSGSGIGATLPSAQGTAWGLLNAITEYTDHDYGRNENNRFKQAQFGQTAQLKEKALAYILEVTVDGEEIGHWEEVEQEPVETRPAPSLLDSLIANTQA